MALDEREGFAVVGFDRVKTETEMAVLIEIDGACLWVPNSLIDEWDVDAREVRVPEWFAVKNGLV